MNAETFSGLWYINKPFVERMQGIILPRINAGIDAIPGYMKAGMAISPFDEDGEWNETKSFLARCLKVGGGETAVIPIIGTMSRFGFCGGGNEFLSNAIAMADTLPQIKSIVIKGHTPGGTVDSTEMVANTIKNTKKKTVGYVAGTVASAGVFAMSQCDEIVIEDSVVAEYGSIGVLMVHVNQQEALIKAGLDVNIFRAGDSIDKAKINGIEPLTDELIGQIQQELDACMKTFKGYVRRGRAGKLQSDEVFSGKMYNKKDALRLGLVDRTGSIEDAIKRSRKL